MDIEKDGVPSQIVALVKCENSLEQKIAQALTPTNKNLQRAAQGFGWHAETLIKRIKLSLPAPVEQYMYLRLMRELRIHPETLAKVLRNILDGRTLQLSDLKSVKLGENLAVRPVDRIAEKIESAFILLGKLERDYRGLRLGAVRVAKLLAAYDEQEAEYLIDSIISNMGLVRQRLNMHNNEENVVIRAAIYFVVNCLEITPSVGNATDIRQWFEDHDRLVQFAVTSETGGEDDE